MTSSTLPATKSTSCCTAFGARVERRARRQHHRAGVVQREQVLQVARVNGVSRGTTTSGRRSLRVTSAARCSRSLDSPSAMPAHRGGRRRHHHHARESGTSRWPGRRRGRRRASSRDGRAAVVAAPARRPRSVPPVRVAERRCRSRRGCVSRAAAGDDQVDRLAGVEQRRGAPRARTACRTRRRRRRPTARRSGPLVIGVMPGRQAVHDQVGQREHEQGDADEAVGGEERPVHPGQVVGADDRVLVDERGRGERQADPPQPAEPGGDAEPDEQRRTSPTWTSRRRRAARPGRRSGPAPSARRSRGRPRRPGRRRSGRSRRSRCRRRARARTGRPRTAEVPVTASQAPTGPIDLGERRGRVREVGEPLAVRVERPAGPRRAARAARHSGFSAAAAPRKTTSATQRAGPGRAHATPRR